MSTPGPSDAIATLQPRTDIDRIGCTGMKLPLSDVMLLPPNRDVEEASRLNSSAGRPQTRDRERPSDHIQGMVHEARMRKELSRPRDSRQGRTGGGLGA